jgi:hypothetical protein
MQHAARTAADIDDSLAQVDADLFELRIGIWGEVGPSKIMSGSGKSKPS